MCVTRVCLPQDLVVISSWSDGEIYTEILTCKCKWCLLYCPSMSHISNYACLFAVEMGTFSCFEKTCWISSLNLWKAGVRFFCNWISFQGRQKFEVCYGDASPKAKMAWFNRSKTYYWYKKILKDTTNCLYTSYMYLNCEIIPMFEQVPTGIKTLHHIQCTWMGTPRHSYLHTRHSLYLHQWIWKYVCKHCISCSPCGEHHREVQVLGGELGCKYRWWMLSKHHWSWHTALLFYIAFHNFPSLHSVWVCIKYLILQVRLKNRLNFQGIGRF